MVNGVLDKFFLATEAPEAYCENAYLKKISTRT